MLYTFRILKVPAAFVPIALNQPDSSKMKLLQHLHISVVVVHTKLLQVRIIIDVCTIDRCMVTKIDEIVHFKCYIVEIHLLMVWIRCPFKGQNFLPGH